MRRSRVIKLVIGLGLVAYLAISTYVTRDKWLPWIPGVATKLKPAADPIVERRPLQEWVNDLSDPNPDVRRLAAETIGNNGKSYPRSDKVAPALGKLLHDPDVTVRAAAIAAFGKVHLWAQGELTTLLELAQGDEEELRAGAIQALVPFMDTEERIDQFFRAAVRENSKDTRAPVFNLLIKAAPQSAAASALITESLSSENEDIRLHALIACCRLTPDPQGNLGTICEILRHRNVNLRRKAAEAASRVCANAADLAVALKRDVALKAIGEVVKGQPDEEVIEKPWLDELPDAGKIKAALQAALKDPDAQVRRHVAETFCYLGAAGMDAKPVMTDLLSDPTPEVRANAVSALGSLGAKARDTESRMLVLLIDSNPQVRLRAVGALREIGADPKPLVKPLLAALDDSDKQARHDAASALGDILAIADKLSDDDYKEIFFALMRKARQDEDELFKKDSSEVILPVHGVALEHLWRVEIKVALIILPSLIDKVKAASDRSRDLWIRALSRLLQGSSYGHSVRLNHDAFLDSEAGRLARAAIRAIVPLLAEELNSPNKSFRSTAAEALANIGPEANVAVLELSKKLETKDKREFLEVNFSLRLFGPDAAPAVPVLIDLMHSDDLDFQVPAVMTLGMIGPAAKDAVPALLAVIRNQLSEDSLASQSASALLKIDRGMALRALQEKINEQARRQLEQLIASARRFDPKP